MAKEARIPPVPREQAVPVRPALLPPALTSIAPLQGPEPGRNVARGQAAPRLPIAAAEQAATR